MALYGAGEWLNDRMSAQLYKAGIHLQRRVLAPFPSHRATAEQWQRSAMEEFDAQLSGGGGLPDALVFYDDYIAAGALLSLARHGVKVPEDVKVLTFSNKGLGPVFFKPLTRFASDHAANAAKIGRWLKARLAGKCVAPPRIAARLIRGSTM